MEPSLHDMDDYNTPLSFEKYLTISTALLILSSFYISIVLVLDLSS